MNYTILLVDDEPRLCASLQAFLKKKGCQVDTACTGREALLNMERKKYHGVLLDIGLPDVSGTQVAATLAHQYPHVAVVILTGQSSLDNAVEALRSGVYDYLQKPCDPERVFHALRRGMEHKHLEEKLKASERRFQQLSESTWEGIIIYEEGRILQVNPQLCEMFGYSEGELLGKSVVSVLLDRSSIKSMHLKSDTDVIGPFEASGIRRDGSRIPVEIRIKHIEYSGRIVQVAAIRDVTNWKQALEKQLALQKELAHAQRLESLGRMAGLVAHDLSNIISGIIIYPELLLLDLDEQFKYRKEIEGIRDAGKRAAEIISDLLTVARGANSKQEISNLNTVVSDYLESVEYRELCSRYPDIRLETDFDPQLLNLHCSLVHITKSVMNLVNNAAEAMGGQGRILIRSRNCNLVTPYKGYETIAPGEYVVLTVQDDGPGIPESALPRIFEPFYSQKKLGRSGSGLGLAVVWNSVHDHGGYVDLESSAKGTCFSLYFPATHEPVRCDSQEISLEECQGSGENILIVDDQQSQREIAQSLLARLGYQPHVVKSGEEAVEFIKRQPVDLVLLDLVMDPGINGCETYRQIIKHVPQQKAIMTSGYSSIKEIDKARELGINQFIKKPYSLQELGRVLKIEIGSQV